MFQSALNTPSGKPVNPDSEADGLAFINGIPALVFCKTVKIDHVPYGFFRYFLFSPEQTTENRWLLSPDRLPTASNKRSLIIRQSGETPLCLLFPPEMDTDTLWIAARDSDTLTLDLADGYTYGYVITLAEESGIDFDPDAVQHYAEDDD